jgi:Rho GTPase-activating protein 39
VRNRLNFVNYCSSEEVEAKLESMQQDQIYSPVKNHPALPKLPLFPPAHPKPFPKPNEPSDRDLPPKRFLGVHHPVPMGFPPQFHPPQQPMQHQHTQQKTAQKSNLLQRLQENLSSNNNDKIAEMALLKECDIEKFAQDNLNLHSKGIFRKKVRTN